MRFKFNFTTFKGVDPPPCHSVFSEQQHTNCCDGRSLVEDVFGAHVLDGRGINSLRCRKDDIMELTERYF